MKLCKRNLISYLNKMNETKKKVIIWGVDDYNVLGLCRQFAKSDFELLFIAYRGNANCATVSKYCTNFVEALTIEDGYNYLMTHCANTEDKAVLINSNDLIAEFIDEHSIELKKYFTITGTTKPGTVKKYDDKGAMGKLAEDIGFLVPQTKICNWNTNISDVKFPCILKPCHQTVGKYNEFKFKVCTTPTQLKNTLRFVRHDSEFLLQQYIPKEKDILIYGARMMDGKTCLAGALIRDRFCGTGESSHGVITANIPKCVNTEHIAQFLERIDYYGLFSVEYGMVKDEAYFFEVNLRNDGTSHFFFQAGANIPLAWAYSSLGLDYSKIKTVVDGDSYYMDEIYDIQNVKEGKISKEQWEKEKSDATVFKYYDKEDLAPYEAMLKIKNRKLFMGSFVAKYRLYIVWFLDKIGFKRK